MSDIGKPVTIDYTNWQGIRSKRRIVPHHLVWGSNQWHKEDQWFIDAIDADNPDKGKRYFALAGIHSWEGNSRTKNFMLVPIDPTKAMIDAAFADYCAYERQGPEKPAWNARTMWRAMLNAVGAL